MAYLSLYRKWRPKNFADIAGQQVVVKTLTNAIKHNRIAHAYLFCGPRGTGKTSTAKVFAKSLNCEQGPTVNPCGECDSCKRIDRGRSMDVIEIDAASNRGIDEIRDLREKVKFSPAEGKYKVYIVDEVHMLTKGAFNALLKTLEEPPDKVVFILATTEPHQLLPTILSRCQRFDFRLHSAEDIVRRLTYICEQEGIEVEKDALYSIVRTAEGSMRDAISLLDQVISYAGERIVEEDVNTVMGKVDTSALMDFNGLIFSADNPAVIERVNEIIGQGKDISQLVKDLIYYYRNLLIIKECGEDNHLVQLPVELLGELRKQAAVVSREQLLELVNIFSEAERELKWSSNPGLILEMTVLKATSLFDKPEDVPVCCVEPSEVKKPASPAGEQGAESGEERVTKKAENEYIETNIDVQTETDRDDQEQAAAERERVKSDVPEMTEGLLDKIKTEWGDFLDYLKNNYDRKIHALLVEGTPFRVEGETLLIRFPANRRFHKKNCQQYAAQISKAIMERFGLEVKVRTILEGEGDNPEHTAQDSKGDSDTLSPDEHPLVQEAIKLFNGKIIKEE